jgi:hypothetical protein
VGRGGSGTAPPAVRRAIAPSRDRRGGVGGDPAPPTDWRAPTPSRDGRCDDDVSRKLFASSRNKLSRSRYCEPFITVAMLFVQPKRRTIAFCCDVSADDSSAFAMSVIDVSVLERALRFASIVPSSTVVHGWSCETRIMSSVVSDTTRPPILSVQL